MDSFTYDAPHFFDFSKDLEVEDNRNAEAFFEVVHESHYGMVQTVTVSVDEQDKDLDQEFFTPLKLTPEPSNAEKCLRNHLRKSISMVNLTTITNEENPQETNKNMVDVISDSVQNLQLSNKKRFIRSLNDTGRVRKTHVMNTRADAPRLNLRNRSISRDYIDYLSQPKRQTTSQENLNPKPFVSMAEAISQFQQKTPKRFHSKSKTYLNVSSAVHQGPMTNTVPQSPALATKRRARPINLLSTEEKEIKEFEEAQKFKIKAHPVNSKILHGPVQAMILPEMKKPPTKPEPFKLTQVPLKKAPPSPKTVYEFHAKPIPKSVLDAPKPIIKASLCTVPNTPKLMKRYGDKAKIETTVDNGLGKSKPQPLKLERTKPLPFSFEERDKDAGKRKEQRFNEIVEQEKKARIFHAKPLPKSIFRSPQAKHMSVIYSQRHNSDFSMFNKTENQSSDSGTFKARPAKVLQMKPFEPKKDDRHLIEISEFQLNTIRRAKEREEFEQKKKEKEAKIAQIIKESEEEILRRELEEATKLRKEAEHKAQPIRKYKEVQRVATKKLTDPVSPNFRYKKSGNKENSLNKSH